MIDWAALEDRFRYLVELDHEHRARALADIEHETPALARKLRGMLEADEQTTLQIGERVQRMASSALLDGELGVGDRIGPWSVIEPIGRGGMGSVYKVERADEQFRQVAALKVVSNIADEGTYDRFRRERQILARLSHANIAGLIDGGVVDDGRPWLVMEYVQGMRIDQWCDHHRLDTGQRLQLFLQVLDAVSFAHRKLVLHKDIKLGNILVNDSGRVQLLDFGTASLLDDSSDSPEAATRLFALTPAFASPEQIRGEPLSTASDTYSLGVVLYYLLTGRMPLPGQASSAAEFERMVSTQIPIRPSQAVMEPSKSDDETGVDQVARQRVTTPTRLRARLRGDLDAIIMTCLRKEPDRRYSSVQMLASDIRAFLDARPVSARSESRLYRAHRFLRLYRWPLGGGLALVLMLAAGMTTSLMSYLEVEQRGRELEQVVDFQQRLIEGMDPQALGQEALDWMAARMDDEHGVVPLPDDLNPADLGRTLIDRQLLAGSAALIDELFADSPELGRHMQTSMAQLYRQLDLDEGVVETTTAAAAMAEKTGDLVDSLRMQLFSAQAQFRLEQHDRAAATVADVLERTQALESTQGRHQVLALARKLEGDLHATANRPQQALAAYRSSLEHREAMGDEALQRVVRQDLAVTLHRLGHLDEALHKARRLEADWLDAVGEDHPRTLTARNLVATVLSSQGRIEEALELQRAVHRYRQRELGSESQFTLVALNNIGVSYKRLGRYDDALAIFDQVYRDRRALFGPANSYTVATATRRGEVLKRLHRLEEAESVFIELVSISETSPGLSRQGLLARLHLEEVRARLGRATDPEHARHLAEALSTAATHWIDTIQPWQMLGRILAAAGDFDGAEHVLQRAKNRQIELLGEHHPMLADTRLALNEVVDARRSGAADPVIITPDPGSF